jgi:hypothetical protein
MKLPRHLSRSSAAALAVALLVTGCGGTEGSGGNAGDASSPAASSSAAGASGGSGSATAVPESSDNGLVWSAVEFGCDFIDDVEARGRVTNNGSAVSAASFTITVLQGGRIVATLSGLVNDLASGQTKTVEFLSVDDCLDGDFEYEIQTDFIMGGTSDSAPGSSGSMEPGDQFAWAALDFGCDFVDDVEARGRVTNNGETISAASFTITILQGGRIVATLSGLVNDLANGQTKTVEFLSLDDCLEGDFEYEIQTDFSM